MQSRLVHGVALLATAFLLMASDGPAEDVKGTAPGKVTPEGRARIGAYLEVDLRGGYLSIPDAVESVVDVLSDEYEARDVRRVALEVKTELLAQLRREAASWPKVTDCDRLDAAFAALQASGIVARQNFTCCTSCGAAEIGAEIEAEKKKGLAVRGYTFFHMQDTEAAVAGRGVCLAYGAVEEGEQATLGIAREIVRALETQALEPTWDGTSYQKVCVELDWKRRGAWLQGK